MADESRRLQTSKIDIGIRIVEEEAKYQDIIMVEVY